VEFYELVRFHRGWVTACHFLLFLVVLCVTQSVRVLFDAGKSERVARVKPLDLLKETFRVFKKP